MLISGPEPACQNCRKAFSFSEGVLDLSGGESYWDMVPKEHMEDLLAKIPELGWQKAIQSSQFPEIRDNYLWADAPSRTDGSYYLPLTKESTVLDLGSGWGSYTFPLSMRTKLVVAADSCDGSLRLISLRAGQDGINNIIPVHIRPIDLGPLPFRSGTFDCVIMNGVLEWVGSYAKKGDPKAFQERALKEAFRILRPGGRLFIGIENRFGYSYFLGAPDDHLNHYSKGKKVSYTTLMPRFMANIISKRKLGVPYRTYTHSICGLGRMIKKAGFSGAEYYYPEKGYRALSTKIIPFKSSDISSSMTKRYGKHLLFNVSSKLLGAGFFCDSCFAIASKEGQ